MACNMACKYCYLEDNTKDEYSNIDSIETLKYAINKFKKNNVIPFNISLHGGEVTTLSKKEFHDLIKYISDYYEENRNIILYAVWKKLYSVTFYLGTHQSTSNVGTSKIEETDGTLNRTFTITNSVRMPVCDNDAKITVTQNATQAFITVTNVTANTTCYLYYDFA